MKTIFTLLASLIMSVSLFAADAKPKSALAVKSADYSDVRVVLDGKRFESNSNSITIQDLNSGVHTVKVYREKSNGILGLFGKGYEMVYNTALNIKAGTLVQITVDRSGRTSITETRMNNGRNDWDRGRDYGRDRDFSFDRDGQWGDYDQGYGYERAMNDREFSSVLQSISKEWLESNKLKSATQIVRTNNLSAAQVKQLVLMFSFESNKLELAKEAYRNTVDKQNYYMINDVFSFNSSKDDLARYIRNFR